ncbi:MAG: ABC transporter permease [Candidatus Hydrogenedentes bacterium]|nr:ABC transporter permease [Candidatus Hydrogenedentota bacterium]
MYFFIIVKVALKSLWANKLRSFLAVLGVIIGVSAVIAMLAIGAGTRDQVVGRLKALGTDLLMIRPGQRGTGGVMSGTQQNLTKDDAEAILRETPNILSVSPVVQNKAQVKYFDKNTYISVQGATGPYLQARTRSTGGFAGTWKRSSAARRSFSSAPRTCRMRLTAR